MHISSKILLGFTIVFAGLFFFQAARVLNAHRYWRESVNAHEEALAEAKEETTELLNGKFQGGDLVEPGVRQTSAQLYALTVNRGRVWKNCIPGRVEIEPSTDPAEADKITVGVSFDTLEPHGIEPDLSVYIFEQRSPSEGGRYLGKYTVTSAGESQITLEPSRRLWPRQIEALQDSSNNEIPWTLYERLPFDNAKVFANASDERLDELFPNGVPEYIESDPLKIIDYETLFSEFHRLYSHGNDVIASTEQNIRYLESANADATLQRDLRQQQIEQLKTDLAKAKFDRDAVLAHQKALEAKIDELEQSIAQKQEQNEKLLADIARMQKEASRIIEERTRSMAASN